MEYATPFTLSTHRQLEMRQNDTSIHHIAMWMFVGKFLHVPVEEFLLNCEARAIVKFWESFKVTLFWMSSSRSKRRQMHCNMIACRRNRAVDLLSPGLLSRNASSIALP